MTESLFPARILQLDEARNFRDFGGYVTRDGHRVRWRQLFRSNKLSVLTARDREVLDGLGIHTVFDLRARGERERDPTDWSHPTLLTRTFRPGHKRRLVDMALDYPPTLEGVLTLMHDFYAEMPRTMAHVFAEMVHAVAAGAYPCIVHCSAGKDRTGVGVAILLAALGVDRTDIVEDYVLTASIPRPESDMARAVVAGGEDSEFRRRYPPEAIAAMMDAHSGYIDAALDSIARDHGTIEGYLRDSLGVDDETLRELRKRLLEPA